MHNSCKTLYIAQYTYSRNTVGTIYREIRDIPNKAIKKAQYIEILCRESIYKKGNDTKCFICRGRPGMVRLHIPDVFHLLQSVMLSGRGFPFGIVSVSGRHKKCPCKRIRLTRAALNTKRIIVQGPYI